MPNGTSLSRKEKIESRKRVKEYRTKETLDSIMKFLECECCGFLAAITKNISHEELICPCCFKVKCTHGGKFIEITKEMFSKIINRREEQ